MVNINNSDINKQGRPCLIIYLILNLWFCRSRSRSPSEARARLPSELTKHFEYSLVEPPSPSQLQERNYKLHGTDMWKSIWSIVEQPIYFYYTSSKGCQEIKVPFSCQWIFFPIYLCALVSLVVLRGRLFLDPLYLELYLRVPFR